MFSTEKKQHLIKYFVCVVGGGRGGGERESF